MYEIGKTEDSPNICELKNEENEIQTEMQHRRSADAYTELYSSTFQDQHPSLKSTSSDSSEVPLIMTSEVKKTVKEMNTTTATRIIRRPRAWKN